MPAFVATVFATACLGSFDRAVDETRAGLIGLSGLDLRACLGVPTDFFIDGDVESQTYRFDDDDEREAIYDAGGMGGVVMGGRDPGRRGDDPFEGFGSGSDASFCQIDFELTKGRVTRVSSQGRTREGMNADSSCLLRARRCVPYEDEARE